MTDTFDSTKPMQTRAGHKAGISFICLSGPWTYHGWIKPRKGKLYARSWTSFGRVARNGQQHADDLVNVPHTRNQT